MYGVWVGIMSHIPYVSIHTPYIQITFLKYSNSNITTVDIPWTLLINTVSIGRHLLITIVLKRIKHSPVKVLVIAGITWSRFGQQSACRYILFLCFWVIVVVSFWAPLKAWAARPLPWRKEKGAELVPLSLEIFYKPMIQTNCYWLFFKRSEYLMSGPQKKEKEYLMKNLEIMVTIVILVFKILKSQSVTFFCSFNLKFIFYDLYLLPYNVVSEISTYLWFIMDLFYYN